ncbi:MAG: hypothetical protein V2I33_23505 [Kangiellaceae bacterium]|nr:hypothetical protein [Kangiellaceae bacterium]
MDGQGVFTWTDGRKYSGAYIDDKKHGYGVFEWPNKRRYEGNWADGKQHGHGAFITEHGIRKEGIWDKGVKLQWLKTDREQRRHEPQSPDTNELSSGNKSG